MRNILALVGGATVTFLAVGWYLGWYKVDGNPITGHQNVTVEINPAKISQDVKKGVVRGTEIVEEIRNGADSNSKPAPLTTPKAPETNFTPPKLSEINTTGGWKSILPQMMNSNTNSSPKPVTKDTDDSLFGIQIPRR